MGVALGEERQAGPEDSLALTTDTGKRKKPLGWWATKGGSRSLSLAVCGVTTV